MTFFKQLILISCLILNCCFCFAQESLTSKRALKEYDSLTNVMESTFSEKDYKTFRRESFSEQELQTYLSQHFQRLDLLPYIEGQDVFKLQNYLHSGNWFRQLGFPKESIKWYKKFFEYYNLHENNLTVEERDSLVTMKSYSYSILAENYAKLEYLDSATSVHKTNIKFVKNINEISKPSAYNNYGLYFYWYKKDLDSALIYFNTAYEITTRDYPNHTLIGSIRDNLADIYIDRNQPKKALPFYKENFKFYQIYKNEKSHEIDVQRLISAGVQLIETEIALNNLNNAQTYLIELRRFEKKYANQLRPNSKLECLKAEEKYYEAQKKYREAFAVSKKRRILNDSLISLSKLADKKWQNELNTISLDRVSLNFKIDRIEKENKIQNQRSKLLIVSLTSSVVLILLLSLFLRRRQHLINAKNKQLLAEQSRDITALKNEQLESEIESKKRDLSDFAINLTHNQEWAESLSEKLSIIKEANTEEQSILLEDLEQAIKNKVTFDTDTQLFYKRLDKLSDSFYSKLANQFSNLSKNEIRLCSLIRLKMDSRSIATMQNITVSSLNTSRYRLRKKLRLSEDEDLDFFIQNI